MNKCIVVIMLITITSCPFGLVADFLCREQDRNFGIRVVYMMTGTDNTVGKNYTYLV